ncbi:hypothetical protein GDO78_011580 [Eleutherodactylus coqui]|uniref:Uncharacterized protein n=1 Tax=Eleutherodactylus coqui TaxID=57060 RepID=A0A8J6F0S3_ELECQ|nr:hypothetical protein GDO78_011580 [Eleutherodactylus coqui]
MNGGGFCLKRVGRLNPFWLNLPDGNARTEEALLEFFQINIGSSSVFDAMKAFIHGHNLGMSFSDGFWMQRKCIYIRPLIRQCSNLWII